VAIKAVLALAVTCKLGEGRILISDVSTSIKIRVDRTAYTIK
jgi:nitrogen regulatory protein PII